VLDIGRREFITLLGGAAVAWPLAARAQQPARVWRIGLLCPTRCDDAPLDTLRQAMRGLGLVDQENIAFVYREAEGDVARLAGLASELIEQKIDVMLTAWGTAAALAAQRATRSVPVIAIGVGDPVAAGLVNSLARPGGNITGFSSLALTLEAKRLELIKEFNPTTKRAAVLWDPDNLYSSLATRQIENAAGLMGVNLVRLRVAQRADLDHAFQALAADRPDALLVPAYLILVEQRQRIVAFAATQRLPAIYSQDEFVHAGGLISYGIAQDSLYRRAATYVDKILKGERPSELPIEQPTTFKLVINLKTAKALGLEVPPMLLARADEVIE
jgi:putative tryptophan/tyrosine transport system substrate-binding protein